MVGPYEIMRPPEDRRSSTKDTSLYTRTDGGDPLTIQTVGGRVRPTSYVIVQSSTFYSRH